MAHVNLWDSDRSLTHRMEDEWDTGSEFSYRERYPDRSNPNFDSRDQIDRETTTQPASSPPRNERPQSGVGRSRSNWRAYLRILWKVFVLVTVVVALYVVFVSPSSDIAFEPIHWYDVIVDTISRWIIEWLKDVFSRWPG